MSNNNPGWTYGFTPTAGQWNAEWATKQDWNAILDGLIAQGGAPSFIPPTAWTPTDASGAALVFTSISAQYVVVGNLVLASAQLTYPSNSNAIAAVIGGLPYPIPNKGYALAPELVLVTGAAAVMLAPVINSSTAAFYALATGAAVPNSGLSLATIAFQLAYPLS